MKIRNLWILLIFYSFRLQAHEKDEHLLDQTQLLDYEKWIEWIGNFHPIVLHFPIALIIMTAIAELLGMKSRSPICKHLGEERKLADCSPQPLPKDFLSSNYGCQGSSSVTDSSVASHCYIDPSRAAPREQLPPHSGDRSSLGFKHAARFMIIAAAITALPTALFGLAYGYGVSYEETLSLLFWWHRFLGLSTAVLAIFAVCFKELHIRKKIGVAAYAISLTLLVVLVTATGYLGGEMTFGLFHLLP